MTRKSRNYRYNDHDDDEDSDFYVVSAEDEYASRSRNPPIMPLQRNAEPSSTGQRVPQSQTQQVRSFGNRMSEPFKLQTGPTGKRSLEVSHETVAPPDVKKKPGEAQIQLDKFDSRSFDTSELLEREYADNDSSLATELMESLTLRETAETNRKASLEKLKELVSELAISIEQSQAIERIVEDIVNETRFYIEHSIPPLRFGLDIFTRLSVARCSDEALINSIVSLFHGGVPQEFIRDCCKDLRRAQRFDIIASVARTVIPALRTNTSNDTGLLSLPALRDLSDKDALPLEIELGLAMAEFQQDIAMKYDLLSDDALLDSIKRRVSLVPAKDQGREFPWFDGQFTLVEPLPGEKDMRWNLRLKATERVVARPVRINFAGTSWTGNMLVSKSDLTNDVRELNGTMNLIDFAGAPKKMNVTMVDGWMSGSFASSNGRLTTTSSLLAKPLHGTTRSTAADGMRMLMLQDGLYLDTNVAHNFGQNFSIDFFFLLPSKANKYESKLMTIFSNGTVSFQVKQVASSSNELLFRFENKDDLKQGISVGKVSFQQDKWIHVCISSGFERTTIYFQGRQVIDGPSGKPSHKSMHQPEQKSLLLGADVDKSSPSYFEGSLCDFRVWSRTLDEAEVQAILTGAPTDQDPRLDLYYPLTSNEDGLGFLQNIRVPSMPLIVRPSLNKNAIISSSLIQVPPLIVRQMIGDPTQQQQQMYHRISSTNSNIVWLDKGFPSVAEGFECRVGLLFLHSHANFPSLQRMQLRIQSMFQLEMKEYPRLPLELQSGVRNLPALHLSLTSNKSSSHSFTLEYASRLNDGTIHNQTKVFSLVLPGGASVGEMQFVEFHLKSNGQVVMLSANNQSVCELPITMEVTTEAPFYVGCHVEPQLDITSFHFDATSSIARARSSVSGTEGASDNTNQCSSCGATTSGNGISMCDECLVRLSGEWSCDHCTTINPLSAPECITCGQPPSQGYSGTKSASASAPVASITTKSAWGPPPPPAIQTPNACPVCTFVNPPSQVLCQMCESPLKEQEMPSSISIVSSTIDNNSRIGSYALAAQQPASSSHARSVQGQNDFTRQFREDERIRRLKDSYLTAGEPISTTTNIDEEDHVEYVFDSTQGLVRLMVSKQPQVIFKCEGELEDGKVACDVAFDSTSNQWTVEGQRVDGEFTFTLTLDGFGERVISGSYQSALRNGRWRSGTYSSLASSLRGLSGSCFAVGLQNMVQGLSNICSQNAVIQALFACQQLRDLILSQDVKGGGSTSDIVGALGKLFHEMETTPFRCIGARALQSTLPAKYRQAEEMDATEFIADVFHAFESRLGANTMRDLLSYPQTTQLQCSTCGETKTTNAEEPTTTILPLPKMFTPIIGMYLYVCKDEHDLPPTQLPLSKMTNSVMTRIPINLVNEKRNVATPLVYLFLERAPIKSAPPPRSPRSQSLDVHAEGQVNVLPITHIEVGNSHSMDAEPIEVFNSQGRVDNAFDSILPLLPICVRRVRFANPITDVQVLKGDSDARVVPNFSRTGPLANIPQSLFTYGHNDPLRPSSTGNEPPVVLAYTSNMPISDVFVGTLGDIERRGLRGYSRCPIAVGEAPDSGDQVFFWFTSADSGGRPPVTRLNIVPSTDVPDQEDENESVCGYIPLGFTSSVAVIQSKNGHGSPITSIEVMTAMNRSRIDPNRSFHVVMDVSSIAEERIEDVYILTDTNLSSPQQQQQQQLRDMSHIHRSGSRFVRSDGPSDAIELCEVSGEAVVESIPHRFEGIVCSTLDDPSRLTLMGRFQDGQNHQLLASWSTTSQSWTSLPGSSLEFSDFGIPRIYEVILGTESHAFNEQQVHGGWQTQSRDGVYLHVRSKPRHPGELPLASLYVYELKVRNGQAQLVEEENVVPPNYEMVGSIIQTHGSNSYDAEEVEYQLFVMRGTHPSQPFVSEVRLCRANQQVQHDTAANAGKISGNVFVWFCTEAGVGEDWSGTFHSRNQLSLTIRRRQAEPARAKLTYLDFLRKPRNKIEGVSYRKSNNEEAFWGTASIEQEPGAAESSANKLRNIVNLVVDGIFSTNGQMCTLRTSSGVSNGVHDEDIRIGIQKDTTEYWEDGQCVFSPRKSGNDIESMLSLAMNSEVLDGENMVECSSGKCRNELDGSFLRRPHLSRKLPGKSPRLLAMHVDRIKFDLASQRPLKDLRKTPLQPTIRVGNETYALFGIVVHVGPSAQSGHYYTYCREVKMDGMDRDLLQSDASSSSWMLLNDATTERVSFQSIVDVLERGHGTETPYLMFYWRMDGGTTQAVHQEQKRSSAIVHRLIEEKKMKERELLERYSASRTYLDAQKVYLFGGLD